MSVDCDRGAVLAIVPLDPVRSADSNPDHGDVWFGFDEIDPDVDLPPSFFGSLKQRAVPIGDALKLIIPAKPATTDQFGGTLPGKPAAEAELRRLRIISVNDAAPLLRSEFLVAEVVPVRNDETCLLDLVKALASDRAAVAIADHASRTPLHGDTRASVLLAAYADGGLEGRESLAGHLATRAPMSEALWRTRNIGVDVMSEHHVRFVTPRVSGFVADAAGSSHYFERKFVPEVRMQYTLAVVLTLWQRIWMDELLSGVQTAWLSTRHTTGLVRSRTSHERLERLRELRNQHAVLIASGTFSPVFESGGQLLFWDDFQKVHGIEQRRHELDQALAALAEAAEIEASVNLERLLAFFTLVVGVPSLVFAVLGVNISRVTSDTGVSFTLVLLLVVLCLLLGTVVYLLASGRGASTRLLRRSTWTPGD